jgi:hypothetical protein
MFELITANTTASTSDVQQAIDVEASKLLKNDLTVANTEKEVQHYLIIAIVTTIVAVSDLFIDSHDMWCPAGVRLVSGKCPASVRLLYVCCTKTLSFSKNRFEFFEFFKKKNRKVDNATSSCTASVRLLSGCCPAGALSVVRLLADCCQRLVSGWCSVRLASGCCPDDN